MNQKKPPINDSSVVLLIRDYHSVSILKTGAVRSSRHPASQVGGRDSLFEQIVRNRCEGYRFHFEAFQFPSQVFQYFHLQFSLFVSNGVIHYRQHLYDVRRTR